MSEDERTEKCFECGEPCRPSYPHITDGFVDVPTCSSGCYWSHKATISKLKGAERFSIPCLWNWAVANADRFAKWCSDDPSKLTEKIEAELRQDLLARRPELAEELERRKGYGR